MIFEHGLDILLVYLTQDTAILKLLKLWPHIIIAVTPVCSNFMKSVLECKLIFFFR